MHNVGRLTWRKLVLPAYIPRPCLAQVCPGAHGYVLWVMLGLGSWPVLLPAGGGVNCGTWLRESQRPCCVRGADDVLSVWAVLAPLSKAKFGNLLGKLNLYHCGIVIENECVWLARSAQLLCPEDLTPGGVVAGGGGVTWRVACGRTTGVNITWEYTATHFGAFFPKVVSSNNGTAEFEWDNGGALGGGRHQRVGSRFTTRSDQIHWFVCRHSAATALVVNPHPTDMTYWCACAEP